MNHKKMNDVIFEKKRKIGDQKYIRVNEKETKKKKKTYKFNEINELNQFNLTLIFH